MSSGRKAYWNLQSDVQEGVWMAYECTTNNTSNPDGLSTNLTSVTRSAAGKFTVVFKKDWPACMWLDARLIGAAGYDVSVTEKSTGATGNVTGCKVEVWSNGVLAAATGTITCDTKANTTQADYFFLNDGQRIYGFELDVGGTGAQFAVGGVAATGTITCDTKANTTDDDFFLLNDGQNIWAVVLDVSGDSSALANGTDYFVDDGCELVVDISGATTAADVSALLYAAINGTSIQMTAADGTGSVTLTSDSVGGTGNTQQSGLGTLHNAWAVTDMTGGTEPMPCDTWTLVDISGDTTAADISATLYAAINATDIQITAADGTGSVTLTNDDAGAQGNTQQSGYGVLHNAWAVTDMTGGSSGTQAAADTTDYTLQIIALMRGTKRTGR